MTELTRYFIDQSKLPADFPTHLHPPIFWEKLGRTVATFGLLEEVLGKAIFVLTATRPYTAAEIDAAYESWLPKLLSALSDTLGCLIKKYGEAVRAHPDFNIEHLSDLLVDMQAASKIRNVLCHSSWQATSDKETSIPFFVNKKNELFQTSINVDWLDQTQQHVVTLICAVINSITQRGWQFPGTLGPGVPVWKGGVP